MPSLIHLLIRLGLDRSAVTAIEYVIIGAVLVATVAVGFASFADALQSSFNTIAGSF